MDTFLTNFDDTAKNVPVEPEYATVGEFWGVTQEPQRRTVEPIVKSGKKLNEIVDPDGD